MFKFVANHLNIQGMKGFPKFQKFAAGLVVALAAGVVSALWCTSLIAQDNPEVYGEGCYAYDVKYGVIIHCEPGNTQCYFARPDGTYAVCDGTNGSVSYPLPPIIVTPANQGNPQPSSN